MVPVVPAVLGVQRGTDHIWKNEMWKVTTGKKYAYGGGVTISQVCNGGLPGIPGIPGAPGLPFCPFNPGGPAKKKCVHLYKE